ncbi:MAG TPA: hypothetical protein VHV77_07420 [Pirellulales bacterium]|nr:hypothetical protein [Pirellulales bacterium]
MRAYDGLSTLTVSIDVCLEASKDHASACLELLDKLAICRLPATWALDESAASRLADRLLAIDHQELALLARRRDFDSGVERRGLSSALAQRFAMLRRAGRNVSTLVGDGWHDSADLELLVRQGVTAVRTVTIETPSWMRRLLAREPTSSAPKTLRWGLRQFSPSLSLPLATGRAIAQAAQGAHSAVVVIDAATLAQRPRALRRTLDALDWIAELRETGTIDVMNIGEVVARMDRAIRSRPTQSILRSSAA